MSTKAISSKITRELTLLPKTKRTTTITGLAQLHFAAWQAKGGLFLGGLADVDGVSVFTVLFDIVSDSDLNHNFVPLQKTAVRKNAAALKDIINLHTPANCVEFV